MNKKHIADRLKKKKKIVFAAISKRNFYYREHISKFILEKGCVPLNPFMSFSYFMLDTIPRNTVREANNNLVRLSDELWVFGKISDGIASEVKYVKEMQKKIRYFSIEGSPQKIMEIKEGEIKFEKAVTKKDLVFGK